MKRYVPLLLTVLLAAWPAMDARGQAQTAQAHVAAAKAAVSPTGASAQPWHAFDSHSTRCVLSRNPARSRRPSAMTFPWSLARPRN